MAVDPQVPDGWHVVSDAPATASAHADSGVPEGWEVVAEPTAPVSDDEKSSDFGGPAMVATTKALTPVVKALAKSPVALKIVKDVTKHAVASAAGAVVGHAVGGPVGAAAGAVIGNTALPIVPSTGAGNYNAAAGSGNVNRLGPNDIAYRKAAGQPMLVDELGNTRAVPTEAEASAAAKTAGVAKNVAKVAEWVNMLGGAQSFLDLAQMAEPDRHDIGFFGIGGKPNPDAAAIARAKANQAKAEAEAAKLGPSQSWSDWLHSLVGR